METACLTRSISSSYCKPTLIRIPHRPGGPRPPALLLSETHWWFPARGHRAAGRRWEAQRDVRALRRARHAHVLGREARGRALLSSDAGRTPRVQHLARGSEHELDRDVLHARVTRLVTGLAVARGALGRDSDHPVTVPERTGAARVRRAEQRDNGRPTSDGDVHRTRVAADEETYQGGIKRHGGSSHSFEQTTPLPFQRRRFQLGQIARAYYWSRSKM